MRFTHLILASSTLAAAVLAGLLAASPSSSQVEGAKESSELGGTTDPLELRGTAFERAAVPVLPARKPAETQGLHNLYRLSDQIVSGSEPHGDEAFAELARMGIETILSVDGKAPDQDTAAKHGLRYVHVPIQYRGIRRGELDRIVKAFRDLEGPFFVHCFHGRHRGPAAAALGRMVVDGVGREQAMAEMRQWCGTAEKYEGLYRSVAIGDIPNAAQTDAIDWNYPAKHELEGFRQTMVPVARSFSFLEDLADRDFLADPEHPDLDALNEADKLYEAFAAGVEFPSTASGPEDFRHSAEQSRDWSGRLVEALRRVQAGDTTATADAHHAMEQVHNLCSRCHTTYRNR